MLNLKALLTKMCQSLIVETGSTTFTMTKGVISAATYAKFRHIVHLTITYYNASSVTSGADICTGTLTNANLRPVILASGISYYGNHAMVATLGEDTGNIIIRNAASTAIAANSTSVMSMTYLVK